MRIHTGWALRAALAALAAFARGVAPPLCKPETLHDVEAFMVDLDGTMYGDMSNRSRGVKAFIDGAVTFHTLLGELRYPVVYLSDSGCKGAHGVDAKFRALGLRAGLDGPNRSWTAANGIAALLRRDAPANARVFMLDSTSNFDGQIDSCLRVLQRSVGHPLPWELKVRLDDREAKEWAARAAAGDAVFVVYCADCDSAAPDGGPAGPPSFNEPLMTHAVWLLANGATLIGSARDDFTANFDHDYPQLRLWLPGPGTFLNWLRQASGLRDPQRFRVVGKGGGDASEFMFGEALKMLRWQAAPSSLEASNVAMVGDTLSTDIAGGQAFGAKTIFISSTGFDHLDDLSRFPGLQPTCHVPSVRDLAGILTPRRRGGDGYTELVS